MKRSLFAVLSVAALLAGCSSPAPAANPTAAPAKPAAAAPTAGQGASAAAPAQPAASGSQGQAAAAKPGAKFQALVDKAKQGDGHLRAALANYTPELIKAWEEAFQKDFGIKITLESEPGHPSREIPQKMLQAQKVGKGIVDWVDGGNPSNFAPIMQQDGFQVPPWETLQERWPLIQDLRKLYPDVPGGPNGTSLQDYCMLNSQTTWTLVYNTRNVKADEVKNITWNDLLTDKWKNRVVWDSNGLGFKELPFHKDWPLDRLKAYTNNLGANGAKLISGGSAGVLAAVTQGEGDIGMASAEVIMDQISQGAPLGITWPDVIPFNSLGTCMPKITASNEALAQIWFAWRNFEGEYIRAQMSGAGARPFFAPEADKFKLGQLIKEAGVTEAHLAQPKTPEDFDKVEDYRKLAIDGMKAGAQSKQKVPYTWGQ